MGLLALGTPLNWEQTKPLADHIRNHGITQFLVTWDRWKNVTGKGLLWGDEVGSGSGAVAGGGGAVYGYKRGSELMHD